MPASVGQIVHYYPDAEAVEQNSPMPAIVTKTYVMEDGSVTVALTYFCVMSTAATGDCKVIGVPEAPVPAAGAWNWPPTA